MTAESEETEYPVVVGAESVPAGLMDSTNRHALVLEALGEIPGDLTEDDVRKLGRACISREVARRNGIKYLSAKQARELERRISAIGATDEELRTWGLTANKNLVFTVNGPQSFFFLLVPDAGGEEVVLAFRVTRSGVCKVASTAASKGLKFGAGRIGETDRFVLCKDFAETLAVESAGFVGVSYGVDVQMPLNKHLMAASSHGGQSRPWRGKTVLVSWHVSNRLEARWQSMSMGAPWYSMTTPLADIVGSGLTSLKSAIESDFAAQRPI